MHTVLKFWEKNNEFHAIVDNDLSVKYYILSNINHEEKGNGFITFGAKNFCHYDELFIIDDEKYNPDYFKGFEYFNYKLIAEY